RGQEGRALILSGSCSVATRKQVAHYSDKHPAFELTAETILDATHTVESVCNWIFEQTAAPLVFTTADPAVVRAAQGEFGQDFIATKIESFFGELAVESVNRGIKKIICAGGETSGAVVTALGVRTMEIGPEIAPGVPALKDADRDLVLALKSGNFGSERFFEEALGVLGQ
ncbi:MAG: nucleotide-binding domain containing protein, partial [Pseudomonadota bacterium]